MRIILGDQKKCPSEKTKQMAAPPGYQSICIILEALVHEEMVVMTISI